MTDQTQNSTNTSSFGGGFIEGIPGVESFSGQISVDTNGITSVSLGGSLGIFGASGSYSTNDGFTGSVGVGASAGNGLNGISGSISAGWNSKTGFTGVTGTISAVKDGVITNKSQEFDFSFSPPDSPQKSIPDFQFGDTFPAPPDNTPAAPSPTNNPTNWGVGDSYSEHGPGPGVGIGNKGYTGPGTGDDTPSETNGLGPGVGAGTSGYSANPSWGDDSPSEHGPGPGVGGAPSSQSQAPDSTPDNTPDSTPSSPAGSYSDNSGWGQDSPSEHGPGPGMGGAPADPSDPGDPDGGDNPIILDLTGKGIKITQLQNSSQFFDMRGDGLKSLTAWAGVGNAILFYDATGRGQLTQTNQFVFTNLDPAAQNDMQAVADLYDTSHNGKLDASDAAYGKFFLAVTNADGSITIESLAQAGVASINLLPSAYHQNLPDGSKITGQTTYTTTSGKTGTAAAVSLAYDGGGYDVVTTTRKNADGSTTLDSVGSFATGGVAFERLTNISANGLTRVITTLNGGGNVVSIVSDVTVNNADGSTTETIKHYAYGTISATNRTGALGTSVTLTNAELLSTTQTTTTTVNGVTTTTILRDQLGGGWYTQKEVDVINADGSMTNTITKLNPDGSSNISHVTATSANGLVTNGVNYIDGQSASSSLSQKTINADGSTTTLEEDFVNAAVTYTKTTQVSADNSNRFSVISYDGIYSNEQLVSIAVVHNSDGSTTINNVSAAQAPGAPASTLTGYVSTTTSADGLTITTKTDQDRIGTGAAPVFDRIEVNAKVFAADNSSYTVTDTVTSKDGSLRSQTVSQVFTDGVSRNESDDTTGDGLVNYSASVSVLNGTTVSVEKNLNPNGTLRNEVQTTTSSDGLTTVTSVDANGAVSTTGAAIFTKVTKDATVKNVDGSSVETITDASGSGAQIRKEQIAISANGLTTTDSEQFFSTTGWDRIQTDATIINTDGSIVETLKKTDGAGDVLSQTVKATSSDRRTVTTTQTLGTTGLVKTQDTHVIQMDGSVVDTQITFDKNGDVLHATRTTTSADGLTITTQQDIQGQSAAVYAASGLAFDRTIVDSTNINYAPYTNYHFETITTYAQNGTAISAQTKLTSPNGYAEEIKTSPLNSSYFTSQYDQGTVHNQDGSITTTSAYYGHNGNRMSDTTTITSANGLIVTKLFDNEGDGNPDISAVMTSFVNADGSTTQTQTDYIGNVGNYTADIITTTSGIILQGLGLETKITRQFYGSVNFYQAETIAPLLDGSTQDVATTYDSQGGQQLLQVTKTTSANGLVRGSYTQVKGDTSASFWTLDTKVLNQDGSVTDTIANDNRLGLISESVTTISANGLSKTVSYNDNGAVSSTGVAIFDRSLSDVTVLLSNGGTQETMSNFNASGNLVDDVVTTISADKQTITIQRYDNETGVVTHVDQTDVIQTQANGAILETITSTDAKGASLGVIIRQTSGNGLVKTVTYANSSGSIYDSQSNTLTYDANGDGGQLDDTEATEQLGNLSLGNAYKTTLLASGIVSTSTMTLTNNLQPDSAFGASIALNTLFVNQTQNSITIDGYGTITKSTLDYLKDSYTNGNWYAQDVLTQVTSANGLSTTTSLGWVGVNPFLTTQSVTSVYGGQTVTTTHNNTDGSRSLQYQTVVQTSIDKRTVTTTSLSDFDGASYTSQTEIETTNVDLSKTISRIGTGSFNAGYFNQQSIVRTNSDESVTISAQNFNAAGGVIGQSVSIKSANGYKEVFVEDTTGLESAAQVTLAATALLNGLALPSSLLSSDIVGVTNTAINSDGTTKTVTSSYFGAKTSLRSQETITVSANGLTTVKSFDLGNANALVYTDTLTKAVDGSSTETVKFYNSAGAVTETNVQTISADGLTKVLTTSIGITDTTIGVADSHGSYVWTENNSIATSTASHLIDANGVDTWTWQDTLIFMPIEQTGFFVPVSGYVEIDLATENEDIADANAISMTLFGHGLSEQQVQGLGAFLLPEKTLNRFNFATEILGNGSFTQAQFAQKVVTSFLNILGRLPTAAEFAQFAPGSLLNSSSSFGVQTVAQMAVNIAQYAKDWTNINSSSAAVNVYYNNLGQSPASVANDYSFASTSITGTSTTISLANASGTTNLMEIWGNSSGTFVAPIGNSQIAVWGSNDTVNASTGNSVAVYGSGDWVTANNSNFSVSIYYNYSTVLSGSNDVIAVNSVSNSGINNYVSIYNTASTLNFSASTTSIGVYGTGNTVTNQAGSDNISLYSTNDTAITGTGSNNIWAYYNNDTITTGAGNNTITTYANNDIVTVGSGNNNISLCNNNGGATTSYNDVLTTGSGNNNIWVYSSNDTINLGSGNNSAWNWGNGNIFNTGTGNNSLSLWGNNNTVNAGAGTTNVGFAGSGDVLNALTNSSIILNGNNVTINAAWNDTLTLNGTQEALQFSAHTGSDVINGFSTSDTLQFSKNSFASFNALMAATTQSGNNTVITLDATDKVTLTNMAKSNLTASMVHFA